MKTSGPGTVALMISVVLWGILIGGVVYSHVVYFPVYLGDLPESSVLVTGKYALHEEIFWMSLHPALIISLIASLILNWKFRLRRKLILVTMFVYLAAIIVTALYFVPELIAFAQSADSSAAKAEWISRGRSWQRWSWLRGGVLLVTYFVLLRALVLPPAEVKDA
jgi:hypothetical protein